MKDTLTKTESILLLICLGLYISWTLFFKEQEGLLYISGVAGLAFIILIIKRLVGKKNKETSDKETKQD